MQTNTLDWIALVLVVLGALNWGVIGFTGLFTAESLNPLVVVLTPVFTPGAREVLEQVIYLLVGVAGLYFFYPAYKMAVDARRNRRSA